MARLTRLGQLCETGLLLMCVPSRIVISTIKVLGCRLVVLSEMPRVNMKHHKLRCCEVICATTMMQQDLWWATGRMAKISPRSVTGTMKERIGKTYKGFDSILV